MIAIVENRIKAEEVYTALEKSGISTSSLTILGKGYKNADEFGLPEPQQQARKQAISMAYWLIPFGFAGGYVFNLITGLDTFDWAGEPGNHIVGGICGAIAGAMGSFFVGGGVGLSFGGNDSFSLRNRLETGGYAIAVQGSEKEQNKAKTILLQLGLEII